MATFVDTNVIVDILNADPNRGGICTNLINEAKARGRVLITDMVFAELSVAMDTVDDAEQVVRSLDLSLVRCPTAGLFRAGKAYKTYREQNAGPKNNVLPDFVIGAHADVEGAPLITSDVNRMTGYFPELQVLKP
ncbi:type II toxin-antitoxin system VapC family toxin [Sphingomonas aestuarii]